MSEKPVMFSDDGIIKDFMPGTTLFFLLLLLGKALTRFKRKSTVLSAGVYYFSKIVNYSDLPPLQPASTIVPGVR